jgi:hypothetical protein
MKQYFSILLGAMSMTLQYSKILPIHSLDEMLPILAESSEQTSLVAFDIDHTLLGRDNMATHPINLATHRKVLGACFAPLTKEHREEAFMLTLKYCDPILIEDDAPNFIKNIQAPVIALTATVTGPLGDSPRAEVFRYEELLKFGFDFSSSFGELDFSMNTLPSYRGHTPTFYRGVLCSNGEHSPTDKGTVLIEFLKQVNYDPKIIVMVDDKLQNLEDIQKAVNLHNPNITYRGLHYLGAKNLPFEPVTEETMKSFIEFLIGKITLS